jgi:hypothetical protein
VWEISHTAAHTSLLSPAPTDDGRRRADCSKKPLRCAVVISSDHAGTLSDLLQRSSGKILVYTVIPKL